MLISDWSSDVCSSDLVQPQPTQHQQANNSETNGMLEVARVAKRLAKITQFLPAQPAGLLLVGVFTDTQRGIDLDQAGTLCVREDCMQCRHRPRGNRSEEHTSQLQSLMRISYAVLCLTKKH